MTDRVLLFLKVIKISYIELTLSVYVELIGRDLRIGRLRSNRTRIE